jgi:hypothetical protein
MKSTNNPSFFGESSPDPLSDEKQFIPVLGEFSWWWNLPGETAFFFTELWGRATLIA